MQDQPTAGDIGVLDNDEVGRLILTVLLDRHPALVALDELVRYFDYQRPENKVAPMFVREGVDELRRMGLVHQLGQFAFASASAVRANQLGG
jgi:hypothetical protein